MSPSPLRVLVVDDEDTVRMFIASALDRAFPGYKIDEASSAEAAVSQLARGTRYALLIVDKHLPGMTGLELAASLRRTGEDVPIILATGSFTPENEEMQTLGIRRCLAKPFTLSELFAAVAAALPEAAHG